MRSSLTDEATVIFVSAYQNVGQSIEKNEVEKCIAWLCVRPAIFFAMTDYQSSFLGCLLEPLVVVGVSATAILDSLCVIEEMNHLVKHRRADVFNRSC